MRLALCVTLLTTQAHAWTFTPGQPCILSHDTQNASIELTYDPAAPLYTLSITRSDPFIPAPVFSMQFQSAVPIAIGTDRHRLTNDNRTLSVADSGFGNVLDGLQFNTTATATLGDLTLEFPLAGAAEPVAAFRACEGGAPAV